LYKLNLGSDEPPIWSSLTLPNEFTLLQRPELIEQIDKEFKNQKDIHTIALVAMGGAGKTTLARQYARKQKNSVVWGINAETPESLKKSFEDLAADLAKSVEDKQDLRIILDIKKSQEREEQVIIFVRDKLKEQAEWFLIYDNVENFIDIQKYFPNESHLWGRGKILITTCNNTIQHNTPINFVMQVEELTPGQKLELFSHIMQQGSSAYLDSLVNKEKTSKFLKEILPFPLDIATAASYLKATGISYDKYLEKLKTDNQAISEMQEKILKKTGGYQKTRYKITTMSLQELIKNKDFCELLLLISLLDSQNIPRSILEGYKSSSIVDDCIYQLNKYSLIKLETIPNFPEQTISIHRSTQAIILAYLAEMLKLEKNNALAQQITHSFRKYIFEAAKNEEMSKMKLLVSHCEKFLTRADLLHEENWILIADELGWIYFYLGNYSKAIQMLEDCQKRLPNHYKNPLQEAEIKHQLGIVYNECDNFEKARILLNESLVLFQKYKGKDNNNVAYNLHHLGMLHFYKGEYETAKQMLKQSFQILISHYPKNHLDFARVMIRLGEVERALGNYKEAIEILNQTHSIYKDHLEKDHYRVGQVLVRIGLVYKDLGHNKTAKEFIEQGLKIYKKHFPSNCDKVAWISGKLGQVENELGNSKEACILLEQSLTTYKKHYPRDFEISWVMGSLGKIHMDLGHYEKARELLEESLLGHEKFYGKNHTETAQIIRELGKLYSLQGDFIKGEDLVLKSLQIYNNTNHPQAYVNFEILAEMYLKKSNQKENSRDTENLRNTSLSYLTKALEVVKKHFSEDSPHISRIQHKMEKIKTL